VFVGGWHDSGDRSYACPYSPWRTVLHPLPPDAFGAVLLGLPEACNRDARRVTIGWGVALVVVAGATAVVVGKRSQEPHTRRMAGSQVRRRR
jgi:hypothetical protein